MACAKTALQIPLDKDVSQDFGPQAANHQFPVRSSYLHSISITLYCLTDFDYSQQNTFFTIIPHVVSVEKVEMAGKVYQSGCFSVANKQTPNLQFNSSQLSRLSSFYSENGDEKTITHVAFSRTSTGQRRAPQIPTAPASTCPYHRHRRRPTRLWSTTTTTAPWSAWETELR